MLQLRRLHAFYQAAHAQELAALHGCAPEAAQGHWESATKLLQAMSGLWFPDPDVELQDTATRLQSQWETFFGGRMDDPAIQERIAFTVAALQAATLKRE